MRKPLLLLVIIILSVILTTSHLSGNSLPAIFLLLLNDKVPPVGTTGSSGVAAGADWEVCRADTDTAWVSAGNGGGTYNTNITCQALGYAGADLYGGNCDTVCGHCGTPV